MSIDRFADTRTNFHMPVFKDVSSLEKLVGPTIKTFFANVTRQDGKKHFVDGCFQFEASRPENEWGKQNMHLQGCLKTTVRVGISSVKALFNSNFDGKSPFHIFSGTHIRPAVKDKYQNLMAYCLKRTSRIAGPWQIKPGQVYQGKDLIKESEL